MAKRRVKCPKCGAVLSVPASVGNCPARCGRCREAFRLPPVQPQVEDTIAGWLSDEVDSDAPAGTDTAAEAPPAVVNEPAAKAPQPKATPPAQCVRLVSLERRGAMFEFPADCLRQDEFRCFIPRVCIHCRTRAHLSAHLIIFTGQLKDSISLEAEHKAGHLSIPQDQLGNRSGPDLLALLPEVPSVPAPANLPMPYWVCDLCSGAGEISGQIQVNAATGRGLCRLFIRNLSVAHEFFTDAGGQGTADCAKMAEFLKHFEEDRWDALPSVVRHRMEQWFRPKDDERFLTYVPDRSFVRTEDGMNGLVVSTHRLLFHHPPIHQELTVETPVTFQLQNAGGKDVLSIDAAKWKRRSITLDRSGLIKLRQSLAKSNFKAKWV